MKSYSIISILLISSVLLFAQSFNPVQVYNLKFALINVNDMAFWVQNNGKIGLGPSGDAGGNYTEQRVGIIWTDGIVWGGYVKNQSGNRDLRVGGQSYSTATQAGWIENGVASDPNKSRIYKIRKDWTTLTHNQMIAEAADLYEVENFLVSEEMTTTIIEQYKKDWYEWPAERGAPYHDLNSNGKYDPEMDVAGLLDADQVLWFVINDLDSNLTREAFGSPAIGLEAQYTLWAYKNNGSLGQFFYKRVKLINKSQNTLEDFYLCQFTDPDVGNFSNDLAGCDSTESMMFAYNGGPTDFQFSEAGLQPAAIGYKIIRGPVTPSMGDSALINLQWRQNFTNIGASSFSYIAGGSHYPLIPQIGNYDETVTEWYNSLRGFGPRGDINNPTPLYNISSWPTLITTKFPLHSDPVDGTGDLDGSSFNNDPADRVMWLNTGPFQMAQGDTQEVIYIVAGGLGTDYLNSITEMKHNLETAELYFYENLRTVETSSPISIYSPPQRFIFQRPYPNPFNPLVNFKYEIEEQGQVEINVFNILGQKVTVLFNDLADVGLNIFSWDASSFAAGVYIIQIRYKSYSLTHKVLLLK